MHLLINDRVFAVEHTGDVETCPPYHYDVLSNGNGVPWIPTVEEPLAQYEWKRTETAPANLVTSNGPPLVCKLVDGQDVVHDYGCNVYPKRVSSDGQGITIGPGYY